MEYGTDLSVCIRPIDIRVLDLTEHQYRMDTMGSLLSSTLASPPPTLMEPAHPSLKTWLGAKTVVTRG